MPASTLSNLGLSAGWADNEHGWGAAMNASLRLLDSIVQGGVIDRATSVPPGSPVDGDLYIVAAGPSGAWSGNANKLARWSSVGITPTWEFFTAKEGWTVWDRGANERVMFDGSNWALDSSVDISGKAEKLVAILETSSTSLTVTATHLNVVIRSLAATATSIAIPLSANEALPIGFTVTIRQCAAGQVTISQEGGVTLNIPTGAQAKTRALHSTVMVHKVATDAWDLTGDLAATV